jgi:hypothetical protein
MIAPLLFRDVEIIQKKGISTIMAMMTEIK